MTNLSSVDKVSSREFKGIAVFTPGGDLVYCRINQKQAQWHLNLCAALQEHLELVELPHFLVPCFTATVDCWLDKKSRKPRFAAEAYPYVYRYRGLLNVLFQLEGVEWTRILPGPEYRTFSWLETYRSRFPKLWENHNLVLDVSAESDVQPGSMAANSENPSEQNFTKKGSVLRLFVSGHSIATEQALKTLQQVLETSLHKPYTLQMVDVSKHPEQAEIDQVSATPTLLRVWPKPVRRLVGELNNPRAILSLLSDS